MRKNSIPQLQKIHALLLACRLCTQMNSSAVHGPAIDTEIMLIGQAPGAHEPHLGRPFAYTAGKTLFKWLGSVTGLDEQQIREKIYFTAVARCFPGKAVKVSGDRIPSKEEIKSCSTFLKAEVQALQPKIILAVGKVAIKEVLDPEGKGDLKLSNFVGQIFKTQFHGVPVEVIPLPHPSGRSSWPHTEPGKTQLRKALQHIASRVKPFLES